MTNPTSKQVSAALQMAAAVAEAIRELGSVPSGHLYARVMGKLDEQSYNGIITVLKKANLVKEEDYLLTWVGPKF